MFSLNDDHIGFTDAVQHQVDTNGSNSIKERMRRLPYHVTKEADRQDDDLSKRGVIEESNSPWAAGVVIVRKKGGSFRFCVDYQAL